MSDFNPLRLEVSGKYQYVLVCEGQTENELLRPILDELAPDIFITYAEGKENARSLAAILGGNYIVDRDYHISPAAALETFTDNKPRTVWTHHDIESYLIYPDWLIEAVKMLNRHTVPKTLIDCELQILNVCQNLISDHAGRHTLHDMAEWIKAAPPDRAQPKADPKIIKGGAESSDEGIWRAYLHDHIAQLNPQLQATKPALTVNQWIAHFEDHFASYTQATADLSTARQTFSGKRILEVLAKNWGVNKRTLRKTLIEQAITYIQARPFDDPRLADFARLITKVTGKTL